MLSNNKFKKFENYFFIIILLFLAILVGLNRIKISNFDPINGDFQNYNPVRRLLDGQIPFKDFAVYLGSGHMFLTAFFQFFIGDNFTKSLFVNSTITFICFEIFTFFLSFLLLKDKKQALCFTLFFSILNITKPIIMDILVDDQFINALNIGLKANSSSRLVRIFIAPLLCIFLYLGYSLLNKSKNHFISDHKDLLKKIYTAIIAGFAIPWSNDGGVSTYISISFVYFLLLIKEYGKDYKKIIMYTLMYIVISIFVFAFVITLITRGNPLSWIKYTLGVSSYQSWYYSFGPSKQNVNLTQINASFYNICLIVLTIYSMILIFKEKNDKQLIFHVLFSIFSCSVLASSYLYQIGSGGIISELNNLCLVIIICVIIYKWLKKLIKNRKTKNILKISCYLFCTFLILSNIFNEIKSYTTSKEDTVYVEQLGGNLSNGEVINLMTKFTEKSKIFSIYSTAISATTNQFQPTGIDYIIHALGNEQRENYLNIFKEQNFDLVEDISKTNSWYGWIRNANWFFYREFYKEYKPIFVGDYNVFYEKMSDEEVAKNTQNIKDYEISIEKIKEGEQEKYSLIVKALGESINGIADVKIKYNSKFNSNPLLKFYLNRYISVEDSTLETLYPARNNNFNIPIDQNEYFIPVTIINGEGVVKISSIPFENSEVIVENAEILNVYTMPFKYLNSSINKNFENHKIYIDNNYENQIIVDGVKQLKSGNEIINIDNVELSHDFIVLYSNDDTTSFRFPFSFEVIK